MLSDADRKKAADILITAEKERKQAIQLTKTFPDIGFDDAYAISTEVAQRRIAALLKQPVKRDLVQELAAKGEQAPKFRD